MMEAGSGSGHQTSPNVVCQLPVLGVAGQHGQVKFYNHGEGPY